MRRLPIYFLVDISGASDINKLNMCLLKILLYSNCIIGIEL